MRVKLNGVHKVKRKLATGVVQVYYYAWRGGPRIHAKPHTEAFVVECMEYRAGRVAPKPETLESLIELFTGTRDEPNPDFEKLARTTQRDHRYAFRLILEEWPELPIEITQQRGMKADIRNWHNSFAGNPRKADKLLFSLSKLFSYAIENERLDKNPCTGINRLYDGSRKDNIWMPDQLALFRAHAPEHVRNVFEAAVYTGQRQGDLLSLKWSQYDGTHFAFLQSKKKTRARILLHPALKEIVDRLPRSAITVFTNSRGKPWTSDGFKSSFGKEQKRAGISGVTFHDLRGTFITQKAREGATALQIAAITGHSAAQVERILETHYLAYDQAASDAVILSMNRNGA